MPPRIPWTLLLLSLAAASALAASNSAVLLSRSGPAVPPTPVFAFFNQSAVPERGTRDDVTGVLVLAEPYDACGNDTVMLIAGGGRPVTGTAIRATEEDSDASQSRSLVVMVSPYNCSVAEKLRSVNRALAASTTSRSVSALLVQFADTAIGAVRNESRAAVNGSTDGVNLMRIAVFVIFDEDVKVLKEQGLGGIVGMHKYDPPIFDPSALVLMFIALSTLVLASLLSVPSHPLSTRTTEIIRWLATPRRATGSGGESHQREEEEEESQVVTWVAAVLFVAVAGGGLLVFWKFPGVVVYVVIAIFTISSSLAVASLLSTSFLPSLSNFPPVARLRLHTTLISRHGEVIATRGDVACLVIGITMAGWWCVERKKDYIWIVQDVLGMAFVANVIKMVGVPNLMVVTLLLSLSFLYDIFFVLITPLFTSSGTSVMESVATGGGTGETVPLLFVSPRLMDELGGKAMLGFGDVVVPGLAVALGAAVDAVTRRVIKASKVGMFDQGEDLEVGGAAGTRDAEAFLDDGDEEDIGAGVQGTGNGVSSPVTRRPSERPSAPSPTPSFASDDSTSSRAGLAPLAPSSPGSRLPAWSATSTEVTVTPSFYLVLCSMAYVVALAVTFTVVALTGRGQPALMYINPSLLATIFDHAYLRGEIGALWKGEVVEWYTRGIWQRRAAQRKAEREIE
ncbi:hypothetical protein HDU93_001835, partial [Gonapodya sp. JEL0774]